MVKNPNEKDKLRNEILSINAFDCCISNLNTQAGNSTAQHLSSKIALNFGVQTTSETHYGSIFAIFLLAVKKDFVLYL